MRSPLPIWCASRARTDSPAGIFTALDQYLHPMRRRTHLLRFTTRKWAHTSSSWARLAQEQEHVYGEGLSPWSSTHLCTTQQTACGGQGLPAATDDYGHGCTAAPVPVIGRWSVIGSSAGPLSGMLRTRSGQEGDVPASSRTSPFITTGPCYALTSYSSTSLCLGGADTLAIYTYQQILDFVAAPPSIWHLTSGMITVQKRHCCAGEKWHSHF